MTPPGQLNTQSFVILEQAVICLSFKSLCHYQKLFLHPEGPGGTPDCHHDSQVTPRLAAGGIRQSNAGCSRFLFRSADSKAWKVMEDVLAKACNYACSTREEKERGALEMCMWDESHQPPLSIPCPTVASTSAPRKDVRAWRGQVWSKHISALHLLSWVSIPAKQLSQ